MSKEKSIYLNELNDKESKFNKLNRTLNWEINMDFFFTYLNQACKEFLGIPPHIDIEKKSLLEHPDSQHQDENTDGPTFIKKILSGSVIKDLRLKICLDDFKSKWVLVSAIPDMANNTYFGKFVDVTS